MKQQHQNPEQRPAAGSGASDRNRLDEDRREGRGAFDDGLRDAQYGTRSEGGVASGSPDAGHAQAAGPGGSRPGGAGGSSTGSDRPDVNPGSGSGGTGGARPARQQNPLRKDDADPAAADLDEDLDATLDDDNSVAGEEDPGAGPSGR